MKVYDGNDGIKQMIYDERRAFVDQMWERYRQTTDKNGNAGDYRILAEICEKLPFFENSEVGQEISRLLNKHYEGKNDYYAAQRHQRETKQVLKLWDDFKRHDNGSDYDNLAFRKTIASIMAGGWTADRVRSKIRERDKNLGKSD